MSAPPPFAPPPGFDTTPVHRRDLLLLLAGWLTTGGSLVAAFAAGLRGLAPNVLFEPSRRFRAGRPDDYADGSVTFLEEIRVFLIRKGKAYRAVSAVCTHLSCTVNRSPGAEGGYRCPCHGSVFDEGGRVLAGPAPRPLPSFEVSLARDGRLVIDAGTPVAPDRQLVLEAARAASGTEENA